MDYKGSVGEKGISERGIGREMEWLTCIRQAVDFIENHMLEEIRTEDVAKEVYISPFYLQKVFKIMTGYSIGEYIRYRRLYLAALDVLTERYKVIDVAYKYGYDTPESFTKAFGRFHGISPSQVKKDTGKIRIFLPLKISVSIQGGNDMDYVVEKMSNFQLIGLKREFSFGSSYEELPRYWDEFKEKYGSVLLNQKESIGEMEKAVCDYQIGEFGVCIDDLKDAKEEKFSYMIAGAYHGGNVPEGLCIHTFPDMEWAKFRCYGKMPVALQTINTKIYKEWLPGNPEYEAALGTDIEWYDKGDVSAADYRSEIWIPVKRK